MIKVVVFDLDDTLISEKEYIKSGFNYISKILCNKFNVTSDEIYNSLLDIFNESSSNVFNKLFERYNISYTKEDILDIVCKYRNHIPNINLFSDVLPTLNKLKDSGIKLGLITDGYKETQRNKIKVLQLENYIDYIIVTDELGREYWKPHQKSFIMMKEYFEVKFEEMVYLGDNIKKDFKAGNELGMNTIQIIRDNGVYINLDAIDDVYKANSCITTLYDIV